MWISDINIRTYISTTYNNKYLNNNINIISMFNIIVRVFVDLLWPWLSKTKHLQNCPKFFFSPPKIWLIRFLKITTWHIIISEKWWFVELYTSITLHQLTSLVALVISFSSLCSVACSFVITLSSDTPSSFSPRKQWRKLSLSIIHDHQDFYHVLLIY